MTLEFPLALLAIPVVLFARLISVSIPISLLSLLKDFTKGAVPVLVWGGLRGGISVALALSLPDGENRDVLLTVTYLIVMFSILVQGLSIGRVVKRLLSET